MTEMDLKLYEFVRELRLGADEFEKQAINAGGNLEVKLVSTMYAYREIANRIEAEFRDKR